MYNYGKINYGLEGSDYLGFQPKTNQWYKLDFILDWQNEKASFYLDGEFQAKFNFYHGRDKQAGANAEAELYYGADTLMLYTLSPGGSSTFANI